MPHRLGDRGLGDLLVYFDDGLQTIRPCRLHQSAILFDSGNKGIDFRQPSRVSWRRSTPLSPELNKMADW